MCIYTYYIRHPLTLRLIIYFGKCHWTSEHPLEEMRLKTHGGMKLKIHNGF